jgi:hypothetical protein
MALADLHRAAFDASGAYPTVILLSALTPICPAALGHLMLS